jgi:methionyl-tRNA formyltransferase
MRLILMGTGPFAIPSFEALRQAGHDIPLVLVRPERPGHGGKLRPAPVRQWADAAGLPVEAFSSTNDSPVIEHLRSLAADLMVVCDYGQILTADCLAAARLGGINLHGSLLPAHRGAAPVQWSILRGDPQAGCSVIWMTPRLDAGPVIAQAVTPVGPAENAADLETRLAAIGCEPILSAIEQLSRLSAEDDPAQIGISQPPRASSLAPRLAKSDGQLDPAFPAPLLERLVRGLQPWPGAFGELKLGQRPPLRVLLLGCRAVCRRPEAPPPDPTLATGRWLCGRELAHQLDAYHPTQPAAGAAGGSNSGEPTHTASDRRWPAPELAMVCQAGASLLLIDRLQIAGKRPLEAAEFVRGYLNRPEAPGWVPPQQPNRLLRELSN